LAQGSSGMFQDGVPAVGSQPWLPAMNQSPEEDHVQAMDVDTCAICLIDDAVEPRTTTCGHIFCGECLERALAVRMVCPLCRRPQDEASSYGWLQCEPAPMPDSEGVAHRSGSNGIARQARDYIQSVISHERRLMQAALGGSTARC
jgi:hypothetical protein